VPWLDLTPFAGDEDGDVARRLDASTRSVSRQPRLPRRGHAPDAVAAAQRRSTRSRCKPGDFVVHEQHGVGRFVEMVQRTVGGATREYLVLEYAASKRGQPGDRLYVPTDQLDQVTRYVGGEAPTLDRWAARTGQQTQEPRPRPSARSRPS
jgi:transcription-repair coupling factor (superfamily II helicase)